MNEANATDRTEIPGGVLAELTGAFGLGAVRGQRYLADGLMNGNWKVDTSAGVFALKPQACRRPAAGHGPGGRSRVDAR